MEVTNSDNIKDLTINQTKFLAAISETGNITRACEIVELSRNTHYRWLDESQEYGIAFDAAMEAAAERLEAEARRRAVEGVNESVWYKGEECGTVKKYSDTLLMFLLKGAKPEKYADRVKQDIQQAQTISIKLPEDAE